MTEGERAILAEVRATRTSVDNLSREIGGEGGLRERLTAVEAKIPRQPCAALETHIALHKDREHRDRSPDARDRGESDFWATMRRYVLPIVALAAAAVAGYFGGGGKL